MESKQQKPRFWRSGNRTVIDSQKAELCSSHNDNPNEEVTLYSQVYASRSLMDFLEQYSHYKHEAALALKAMDIRDLTQPIAASGPISEVTVFVIEEIERMSRDLQKLARLQQDVEQRLVKVMKVLEPPTVDSSEESEPEAKTANSK